MLGTDKTITIFNRYIDAGHRERWQATVIAGASWYYSRSSQVTKDGLSVSESCIIRVPNSADANGKRYVYPKEFVPNDDSWTASPKDKVVLGEISGAPEDNTLPTWLEKNCNNVITVNAVTDNRGKPLAHIRIGGV